MAEVWEPANITSAEIEGAEVRAVITTTYFLKPDGEPIVRTCVEGGTLDDLPSFFETVAMQKIAEDSIKKIYKRDPK